MCQENNAFINLVTSATSPISKFKNDLNLLHGRGVFKTDIWKKYLYLYTLALYVEQSKQTYLI